MFKNEFSIYTNYVQKCEETGNICYVGYDTCYSEKEYSHITTAGQGSVALAVGAGGGCLDIFFLSSIISLFFLPVFGRRPDID